jgi:hypothetical protein
MKVKLIFLGVALASAITVGACEIGDRGKTGMVFISDACSNAVYTFTCGGTLGNEVIITGRLWEQQTGACMLV